MPLSTPARTPAPTGLAWLKVSRAALVSISDTQLAQHRIGDSRNAAPGDGAAARPLASSPRLLPIGSTGATHSRSGFASGPAGHMSPMPSALRVCLTLSGGASLGAYQAGASAALLAALECIRDDHGIDVRVDAIGGASAGSIVGLIAAHALLEGGDGCRLLHEAWVERVTVDTLLRGGARGRSTTAGRTTSTASIS